MPASHKCPAPLALFDPIICPVEIRSAKSVVVVVGTRPEVIKMAPLVHELRRRADVETSLVSTGQHRDMSAQSLASFELTVNRDLAVMREERSAGQDACLPQQIGACN